jgi:DMSO/TMAO reductase YedYZ molybdopterin-dependent catalytic subunit
MALVTRRTAILAGLASAGGLVVAARFPKELPPTYGSLLRAGDSFTYGMQRALLPGQSLVREYSYTDISSFPAIGTTDPASLSLPGLSDAFARLQHGTFADYRLAVDGRVARPQAFSLDDLKRLPARTQITKHTCEEGWTAIAEWTGVPLARVLDAAGILPSARFIVFHTWDDSVDSIDLIDALHPQTLLAYGMNGRDLPVRHGAPLRLRLEHQMGYRSFKYLKRIVVSDTFESGGKKGAVENGWAWYTGI